MIEASSINYIAYDKIGILDPDGNIKKYTLKELGYPYFYSSNNILSDDVVSYEKVNINVLLPSGIETKPMYKIYARNPFKIRELKEKSVFSVEDDFGYAYIDRQLGADNVVSWVKPNRYAYIDIETKNGKPFLIGYVAYINGERQEYIGYTTIEDFIDELEIDKIAAVIGYNSNAYDYKFFEGYNNTYWKMVMKLDGMLIYSKFRQKSKRSLDAVSRYEGFSGKEAMDKSIWKQEEILLDEKMIKYNRQDCIALAEVIEKYDLIGNLYTLSNETGVSPARMYQSNYWAGYVAKNREKYGVYLLGRQEAKEREKYEGSLVFAKKSGLLHNVSVFDYTSLYPKIVETLDYDNAVYMFMKQTMKDFVAGKEENRKKFKETKDRKYEQLAESNKVLANGSYGLFGSNYWQYYNKDVAEFITQSGQKQIMRLRNIVEADGYNAIQGDTDSCFVEGFEYKDAVEYVNVLLDKLKPFPIKLEKFFTRLFVSGDEEGAKKKKYFGITNTGEVLITGMETIRNDRCLYAKKCQKELINVILYSPEEKIYENSMKLYEDRIKRVKRHTVPIDELAFTRSISTGKNYKVDVQQKRAYEKLKQIGKAEGAVVFVDYWIGKKHEVLIYNELDKGVDWDYYLEKQIRPVLERIINALKHKNTVLESFNST